MSSSQTNWTADSSLREFYDHEFTPTAMANRSRKTRNNHAAVVGHLEKMFSRPPVIGDLSADTLNALLAWGKWRLDTQETYRITFRRLWTFAAKLGVIDKAPPGMSQAHGPRHGPVRWTKREFRKLYLAAGALTGEVRLIGGGSVHRAAWWQAYFAFARDTGLSWAAIRKIRCGDITPSGTLVAKSSKSSSATPTAFKLRKRTFKAMRPLLREPHAKPFAIVACARGNCYWFHRLVAATGLDKVDRVYRLIGFNGNATPKRSKATPSPASAFDLDSPLAVFAERCYFPQKMRIGAEKTRDSYLIMIRQFGESLGRAATLGDLTDENVCAYLGWLRERGLSPHTVSQRRNYIMALANWCSKRGVISWWLTVDRVKAPDVLPTTWTLDELRRLLAACEKFPGSYCGVPAPVWWKAFHYLHWDTGERTSATLAVEVDWLNVETGVLAIPGEARKGGIKAAVYELKRPTVDCLAPLVANAKQRDGKLFAFPFGIHTFYHHYTRLLKAAGLPSGRRNKPQKLRRTFATMVELAGGDATQALGHSCRRVTEESYIDPRVVRKPAANLLLPAIPETEGGAT